MIENKQYITNNPHNKSYIFCDSVRLNNIEVAKTLNELVTKCNTLTNENDRLKKENDQLKRKIGKVY
jgi:regulator of replication initiation timing